MTESTDWSIDDFLTGYRPVERIVPITTRGDLLGRLEQLESDLKEARQSQDADSISGGSDEIGIAEEIQDVRRQVRESSRKFRVASMGDRAWSDLVTKHQEGKEEGAPWNAETFWGEAFHLSITDPAMSVDQAEKLLDVLSVGQIGKLARAVTEVNGGGDDLPKSDAPSVLRNASTPKRPTASHGEFLDLSSSDE